MSDATPGGRPSESLRQPGAGRRQALRQGDPNHVAPTSLNAIDRRVLREALRQAAMLQDVMRVHYR